MRTLLLIFGLAVAGCISLPAPITDDAPSSALPIEAMPEPLDITPEPFVDPLVPVTLTGSITVRERMLSGSVLEIGAPYAPHTFTLFLNVESPYAQEFFRARLPVLVRQFVHPDIFNMHIFLLPIQTYRGSEDSARAVTCAAVQGKGYAALEALMTRNQTSLSPAEIATLELDATQFTSCIQTTAAHETATSTAASFGITRVPSYVLRNEVFVGLPTEADLLGTIRAALE